MIESNFIEYNVKYKNLIIRVKMNDMLNNIRKNPKILYKNNINRQWLQIMKKNTSRKRKIKLIYIRIIKIL